MLTTALRPSSFPRCLTTTHLRPVRDLCVERRVEQHTIEAVLLQPS